MGIGFILTTYVDDSFEQIYFFLLKTHLESNVFNTPMFLVLHHSHHTQEEEEKNNIQMSFKLLGKLGIVLGGIKQPTNRLGPT